MLIVDSYSKIPKLYDIENITTAEVMDKLDMFQSILGKMDQFGWWDLERISADAGAQFTSIEFKDEFQHRGVRLTLAAQKHALELLHQRLGHRYTISLISGDTSNV